MPGKNRARPGEKLAAGRQADAVAAQAGASPHCAQRRRRTADAACRRPGERSGSASPSSNYPRQPLELTTALPYVEPTCRLWSKPRLLLQCGPAVHDRRAAVVDRVAADPRCGVVIPGSGGIRKLRFGFRRPRQAWWHARDLFVWRRRRTGVPASAFAKNEKSDLAATERMNLSKHVAKMLADYRRRT